QQLPVAGAAAQEHVLAGVDLQVAAGERAGRAAQPGPGLEQGDADARLAQGDRRGDAGQPAADHHDAAGGHGRPPARVSSTGGPPSTGPSAAASAEDGFSGLPGSGTTGPSGPTAGTGTALPARARAATSAFALPGSDWRCRSAAAGAA